MRAFLEPLRSLEEMEKLRAQLRKEPGIRMVSGCIDPQKPHLMYGLGNDFKYKVIVTFNEQKARELCEEYRFFEPGAVYYPAKDILFYQSDLRGNVLTRERILALKTLAEGNAVTIVTTYDALMNRLQKPDRFLKAVKTWRAGDAVDLQKLKKELVKIGYEPSYQVESAGQFAVRGGIVDIFPLTEENPYRMELWGDEIDSLRSFDVESQRSIENLESIEVYPAQEMILSRQQKEAGLKWIQEDADKLYACYRKDMKTEEAARIKQAVNELAEALREQACVDGLDAYLTYFEKDTVSLLDYFPEEETLVFLDEAARCAERGRMTEQEFSESMKQRLEKGYILPGQMQALYSGSETAAKLEARRCVALGALDVGARDFSVMAHFGVEARSISAYNNSFELLIKDLKLYKRKGYAVILLSGSRTRAKRLAEDLLAEGLNCFYTEDYGHVAKPEEVMVLYGKARKGYEYPLLLFAVISESDIFGSEIKKKKKKKKAYEGEKIASFAELSIGDYVVHENHGLGIYRGIEKIEVDKAVKDYIKIEYDKGSSLYILATQLDVIQKYASADAKRPKLNKLGGQEWHKTKSRVQGAVKQIASELVDLYAKRQKNEGFAYGADTVWQREFEEMFPFEETEDQEAAIEATKRDMESRKIMDRLICGDVGYGKTEIAIRAAFKAVQEGKQVVYLVPTTILAQQHYNTFSQRMKDFPVVVDLLCRFKSSAEQKKTVENLKRGMADIVIGTHRVLSKDVEFKDLGLLIIDEEQRFGVTHKEKIKRLKTDVDVLTLTATPIPRTLHMSLIGIRDMSVLEEPPLDRLPIQTYVMEYDEEMVREAIARELARGGQVYYVFNRVNQIADVTAKIASLVPQAAVEFAHGQMKERELENIMYRFINGEIDVLVSTTIIETGLDISNVNTMIIQDADNMGLSQLYQLRGRVGRSSRTAYAFLLYRRNKMLKEVAEKRLAAIREYTELGSGFKIAMRDLEIRGAGNLLGAEQHGHMQAVGYDLYCKLLNEAVKQAKGIETGERFETAVDVDIDAFIPSTYVPNEAQKLDLYKRIAGIENREEKELILEEFIDRFGDPPKPVENLLMLAEYKAWAHRCYFTEVSQKGDEVCFALFERAKLDPAKIPEFVAGFGGKVRFYADRKAPCFIYFLKLNSRQRESAANAIEQVLKAAGQMVLPG